MVRPCASFTDTAVDEPCPGQRGHQPRPDISIQSAPERPFERRPEVVMLSLGAVEPGPRASQVQARLDLLRELQVASAVIRPDAGRFVTILARPDLPKLASNDPMNPSPAEAKALAVGSLAYFGTYTVDEPSKTIVLKLEASTLPNQLGFEGKRVIDTLTADELKYTNTTAVGDLGPVVTSYRRAK